MWIRKTFGRLRALSRSVTTGQVESQQLDEEYLSAKSYETIPKVSSLKILWSMMDSKEKTMLDKVIKGYHDTAGNEFSTALLRGSHEYTMIDDDHYIADPSVYHRSLPCLEATLMP